MNSASTRGPTAYALASSSNILHAWLPLRVIWRELTLRISKLKHEGDQGNDGTPDRGFLCRSDVGGIAAGCGGAVSCPCLYDSAGGFGPPVDRHRPEGSAALGQKAGYHDRFCDRAECVQRKESFPVQGCGVCHR